MTLNRRDNPVTHVSFAAQLLVYLLRDWEWAGVVPKTDKHGNLHLFDEAKVHDSVLVGCLVEPVRVVHLESF